MSGVTPLNIIVRELRTLAQAHDQVKTFAYGHFLDVIKDNVVDYALVHVNIRSTNKAENANTFSIELGVMDKTFKDDSNIQDVESNTYQIFIDLFNIISYSPRWQTLGVVTSPSNPQKFRYKGADEVTGWGGTISFEIYEGLGFCDVPVTGYDYDAPIVPVTGPAKYQNSDLTFAQSIDPGDTYTAPDISFTDSDGLVSAVPANKNITATPCVGGTMFDRPPVTYGRTTSYYTGDDGWQFQAGTYTTGYAQTGNLIQALDASDLSRETLLYNNQHGNKNRFTDGLGGNDWTNAVIGDLTDKRWLTQDHLTGLEWINYDLGTATSGSFPNSTWKLNIANAIAMTIYGYSDYRIAAMHEVNTIIPPLWVTDEPFNNGTYMRQQQVIGGTQVHTCSMRSTNRFYSRSAGVITGNGNYNSSGTLVPLILRTMT